MTDRYEVERNVDDRARAGPHQTTPTRTRTVRLIEAMTELATSDA